MYFETMTSGTKCTLRNACTETSDVNVNLYQKVQGFLSCTGLAASSLSTNEDKKVGYDSALPIQV